MTKQKVQNSTWASITGHLFSYGSISAIVQGGRRALVPGGGDVGDEQVEAEQRPCGGAERRSRTTARAWSSESRPRRSEAKEDQRRERVCVLLLLLLARREILRGSYSSRPGPE